MNARPGAKFVTSNGYGSHESFPAGLIWTSIGGEAKGAVGLTIPETEAIVGRLCEVLNSHPDFALRCQKPVDRLELLFCFRYFRGQPKTRQRPKEHAPVEIR